jgi:hypothetical protein
MKKQERKNEEVTRKCMKTKLQCAKKNENKLSDRLKTLIQVIKLGGKLQRTFAESYHGIGTVSDIGGANYEKLTVRSRSDSFANFKLC